MADTSLIAPALTAGSLSLLGLHHLWKSSESRKFKLFMSVFLLVPLLGPLFYFFIEETPEELPDDQIKLKEGVGSGLGMFGNFGRSYEAEDEEIEETAKKLKRADRCGLTPQEYEQDKALLQEILPAEKPEK